MDLTLELVNTVLKGICEALGGIMVIYVLKLAFPILMVIGALGSLIVNMVDKGDGATSLQWLGAAILYTALTFRNIK